MISALCRLSPVFSLWLLIHVSCVRKTYPTSYSLLGDKPFFSIDNDHGSGLVCFLDCWWLVQNSWIWTINMVTYHQLWLLTKLPHGWFMYVGCLVVWKGPADLQEPALPAEPPEEENGEPGAVPGCQEDIVVGTRGWVLSSSISFRRSVSSRSIFCCLPRKR